MAVKTVDIDGVGTVKLVKSSRNRSLRLTVSTDGTVRVSMPYWTPYSAGIAFARQQAAWILRHTPEHSTDLLEDGQKIGKLHKIIFMRIADTDTAATRVTATKIIVKYHSYENTSDEAVQDRARTAVLRALKKETLQLLGPRLKNYAATHSFLYRSVSAKQLKRRWGSCDSQGNIIFNLYLMQLPWELIDYVILHELTHTQHMHHGPAFWSRLKEVCPASPDLRRQIKHYHPLITPHRDDIPGTADL